jgi:NAD(P)-dependent dehydrogenase (short-subunit alcohol dehydrogenase family)
VNLIHIEQSKAGCDALIAEFKRRETTLHVLVNNSGITWGGPYNDFPEEKGWDNVFNVNVKSVFYSEDFSIWLI